MDNEKKNRYIYIKRERIQLRCTNAKSLLTLSILLWNFSSKILVIVVGEKITALVVI
jgi:hypothetical protein